jgi:UDP-2,3-diacylglucosamine hydrolase
MILILSDIHLGRADSAAERAKERDLLDLIDSVVEELSALVLLGDVFDQFVEYRHLVPKGFLRFQARLAALADSGTPVQYVVGNHDPWHLDYFEAELGVKVAHESMVFRENGRNVMMAHGDHAGRGALSALAQRAVRHSLSHSLFRTVLPADFAYRLTRWTRNFLSSEPIDPRTVEKLGKNAAKTLLSGEADVVIFGHSHLPRCESHGEGVYVNAGSFDVDRTFVTLRDDSIVVSRWNGDDVFVYPFVIANDDRFTV